jgi:ABC-type glycerol-3-phosphate transport system substrate-binding protein
MRIVDYDFKPIPDDPKQLEMLQWMQDVWNAGIVPDASPTMGWVEQGEYFKKGRVASFTTWCVVVGEVLKEVPGIEPVLGFAPCVKKVYSASTNAGWIAAIPYNSAKKDSAWEFVKWVNSKEVQRKLVEAVGGIHGTGRYSIMTDPTVPAKAFQSAAKDLLDAARAAFIIPEYGALMDTLTPIIAKCVYEGVSPEDTLRSINIAVEALLRGAGYYG